MILSRWVIHRRVINILGKRCRIAIQDQRRTLETTLRKKSSTRGARVLLITSDSGMKVFEYLSQTEFSCVKRSEISVTLPRGYTWLYEQNT